MARPQDPVDPDAPEEVRRLAERLREAVDGADHTGVREQAERAWRRKDADAGEGTGSDAAPAGPGLHSIRPPLGELPARVRGRDGLLALLGEALAAPGGQVEVLHGLGGCGKTTLALRLARDARALGYTVFWVSADEPDRMVTALREVALELGADEEQVAEAWAGGASATDLLWGRLEAAERPWLLVFDNADSPDRLAEAGHTACDGTGWVRAGETGLTVVTTRVGTAEAWGEGPRLHPVRELSAEDGADVLIDLAGNAGTEEEARALSERLGGLPLALRLAGSYLARTARGAGLLRQRGGGPHRTRTFDAYLEAVGDLGPELLDQGLPPGTGAAERLHRRLISRTWELSLDLLDEQGTVEARPLMRLLSCFSAEPFPVDLLDVAAASRHGLLPEPPDLDRVDRALEALVDLGLVEVVELPEVFAGAGPVPCLRAHRLVLDANAHRVRESDGKEREAVWGAAVEMLAKGAEHPPESTANWGWWRLLAPHVIGAMRRVDDRPAGTLSMVLYTGVSTFAYLWFSSQRGRAEDLVALMRRRSEKFQEEDAVRLVVRHRYAIASLPRPERLEELSVVVAAQRRVLGDEHPETLTARHDLALLLPNDSAETEAEFRAVLEARRRVLGVESSYTEVTLRALIGVMSRRGKEEESQGHYDELIQEFPESRDLLSIESRHHTAHRLDDLERYEEAEHDYRAVLSELDDRRAHLASLLNSGEGAARFEIEHAIAENRRKYGDLLRCLADNLVKQQKQEGLKQYRRLLELMEETGEASGERWLGRRHDYGDFLARFGHHLSASNTFQEVLADRLETNDECDTKVLQDRHCLAHALQHQERFEEAAEQLILVHAAFDDLLGPIDPKTLDALGCLAFSTRKQGDLEEALRLHRQLYRNECELYGPDHAEPLMTRQWIATLAHQLEELSPGEARAELEEVLALLPEAEGAEERWVTAVRERLAGLGS
ncbi:tetratricopeptide repeat protein [Nocardiopsis ganjiahuensis]|uniref:tetratricopeptide repeat protein n=1 Tax=Nocardiopsis ganjiahuensis TaxID=239984 RepID=UPI0003497F37|nr:tetratricopeptide repeat protein [Nocardiopsis ganjiahuensis]